MAKSPFLSTRATIYLGGVTAISASATDISLPATGVIARDYAVAESQGALLIGAYLIAYGVGQLFWGLFSDAYGRKFALQLSLVAFAITSFACALAPSFTWLVVLRALQGMSAGAPVICRAMVRDVATGTRAARILAVLAAVLTVSTMIAPILGSGLLILFAWPAIFYALALFSMGYILYTARYIPDTEAPRRPERFSFEFVLPNARRLFGMSAFFVPMLQGGFVFAGYAGMLSTGAILTESVYGVDPEAFGALFAFAALSNTAGALLTRRLLGGYTLPQVNRLAVIATGVAATASCALLFFTPSLPVFWAVICIYVFSFGMILPTSNTMAMDPAGDMPGFAASLIGSVQVSLGALGSALAALAFTQSHHSVPLLMAIFGAMTVVTSFFKPAPKNP
ncbi:MFS transporter [Cognatishimia sp.]|uniref:MFS transporter n=1 Tax=Cognatishimia sp. TaxID=2211648 RepID=UPI003517671A